ncbi:MAG: DUF4157 domain-containing protein [Cyanobacteria bacterium J06639_16]
MMQLAERKRRHAPTHAPTELTPSTKSSRSLVSPLALRSPIIQPQLTVNQPGDPYEQEADAIANAVMRVPEPLPQPDDNRASGNGIQPLPLDAESVQRKCATCESEDLIQRSMPDTATRSAPPFKPLAATITPLPARGLPGNRLGLQRKCVACEQEERVQRQGDGPTQTSLDLEQQLQRSQSQGRPLSRDVRAFMEPHFGVDLSPVRVHTGSDAAQMNRALGAQAFTHGRDIYFGVGKAPGKNALTAHELTHTVQQGQAGRRLQMAEIQRSLEEREETAIAPPVTASQPAPTVSLYPTDDSADRPIQRLELPDLPSFSDIVEVGEDILDTGSELISDAADTISGIASEIWDVATNLASALGGVVTLSGSRLIINVPPLPVCPTLPVQFTLPEIGGDIPFLAGVLPVTSVVSLYGALGFHAGIIPELSGQLGPCTLNGLRIVIDPFAASLSASGSMTVMTAIGLGGELRLGLDGEVGVLILWPDPPLVIQVPVVGLEAGLAGFGRGILASSTTLEVSVSAGLSGFSFRANRYEDLGLGLDLGLAGYGALSLLGQRLCTLYWPFWEWHRDATVSTNLSVSLDVGSRGASAAISWTEPALNVVPFDALPLELQREMFSDDCPLCDAFFSLGLMPSQKGGDWTGHPKPSLDGPLEIYPRDPDIASGSKCRGACGPDCTKCDQVGDLAVCEDIGSGQHRFWIYKDVAVCPTHEGCRRHDAGYDWCAATKDEKDWGPCHLRADFEAVCRHGVPNAVSWIGGGPPNDPTPMLFADRSTSPTGCTGPCPDDSEELSSPRTYQLCLPDIPLFDQQSVSDRFGTSTGNIRLYAQPIEVPYLGFVMLNVFARGSLNATVGADLGPAWLANVCLTVDPFSGVYAGMAELHVQAGLQGSLTLTGTVGATADWLCLLEVIRVEGSLQGTGRGVLDAELINTVTVGCVNGELVLDNTAVLEPCLNLSFDLDAMLMVQLFRRFTLFRERWNLLRREWGDCWQLDLGGFSIPLTSSDSRSASAAANAASAAATNAANAAAGAAAAPETAPIALEAAAIDARSLLRWLFSAANDQQAVPAPTAGRRSRPALATGGSGTLPAIPDDPAATAGERNPCGREDDTDREDDSCKQPSGGGVTLNLSYHHAPTARDDCGNAGDIGTFGVTGNIADKGAIIQKVIYEYDYHDISGTHRQASGNQEGYYEAWSVYELSSGPFVAPNKFDYFNFFPIGSNNQNKGVGTSGWWKITGQAIYAPCFDPYLPEDANGWVRGDSSGDPILGRALVLLARPLTNQPTQWDPSVSSVERLLKAEWDCSDEDAIQPTDLGESSIVRSQAYYPFNP